MESGAFFVDKPAGVTSSGVVTQIKWAMVNHGYAPKGFRIGHGGTLDPFATGALVVLFGEATKLADTYLHSIKAYDGIIDLGSQTDTGDLTGEITNEKEVPSLSQNAWNEIANTFLSEPYFQTPPMYSAKKKDGVALHTLAREGITIDREAILKKISQFQISFLNPNQLQFEVTCESGTYVRVLAEDLAKKAATLAHLKTLRRIRSSDCLIADCISLEVLLQNLTSKLPLETIFSFKPLSQISTHLPETQISAATALKLRQGSKPETEMLSETLFKLGISSRYALAKLETQPVALFENLSELNRFRLQRVFN